MGVRGILYDLRRDEFPLTAYNGRLPLYVMYIVTFVQVSQIPRVKPPLAIDFLRFLRHLIVSAEHNLRGSGAYEYLPNRSRGTIVPVVIDDSHVKLCPVYLSTYGGLGIVVGIGKHVIE